jgi:Transaldolase/Fructose-6-phosphate aldolase
LHIAFPKQLRYKQISKKPGISEIPGFCCEANYTEAASKLIAEGIRITLTGVYAVHQVLIAAALGADSVAPYLGRINDLGRNGRDDLVAMRGLAAPLEF